MSKFLKMNVGRPARICVVVKKEKILLLLEKEKEVKCKQLHQKRNQLCRWNNRTLKKIQPKFVWLILLLCFFHTQKQFSKAKSLIKNSNQNPPQFHVIHLLHTNPNQMPISASFSFSPCKKEKENNPFPFLVSRAFWPVFYSHSDNPSPSGSFSFFFLRKKI